MTNKTNWKIDRMDTKTRKIVLTTKGGKKEQPLKVAVPVHRSVTGIHFNFILEA